MVFAGLFIYFLNFLVKDICSNEIVKELISPDNKTKVILFQRDCGATTDFSTQISIISAHEDLPNDGGNIFVTEGHPNENDIEITWLSPTKLAIRNILPKNEIHKKELKCNNIQIIYSNGENGSEPSQ